LGTYQQNFYDVAEHIYELNSASLCFDIEESALKEGETKEEFKFVGQKGFNPGPTIEFD